MQIGDVGNYYGGLHVKEQGGKFWWAVENYDGFHWEEITERLYRELMKFGGHSE